jgi:hypothetical protein
MFVINTIVRFFVSVIKVIFALLIFCVILSVVFNNQEQKTPVTITNSLPEPSPVPPPKGWSETGTEGIYYKWCKDCSPPEYNFGSYVQLKIWCKDKACGDIYAKVNLIDKNGTVVGWTNDTAYGGLGQKVVLTFNPTEQNYSSVEITELHFR